jgi:alpha-tubulin suppressor-like RCC1 family protein
MTMPKVYGTNRIKRSFTFLILLSMIVLSLVLSGCSSSGELTWSVTGVVLSGGSPLAGVTVTLTGPSTGVYTTDANGNYSFGGLQTGTYAVTPSLAGYTFVPTYRPVYLYGSNADGFNFYASRGLNGSATNHTLYRKSDGTVWAWGLNNKSQLGDLTTTNRSNPVQSGAGVLSGITVVAAGNEHSLALKSDGTVWGWGSNSNGQLGNGVTAGSQTTPVQVSGLTNVTAIAAGVNFSLALKGDGSVWAWGYNGSGQLGDGTTTDRWSPVQVFVAVPVAIAAGFDHSLAMTSGGVVYSWGNNSKGQLGNGSTTNSSTPVQAGSGIIGGALAISAGNQFSVALLRNYLSSYLWAWGSNSNGQLGNGTNVDSVTPVQVGLLANMTAIAAGENHAISLNGDGTVWAWGGNSNGQLGDGTTTARWTPVQVNTLTRAQGIIAGYQDSFASTTLGVTWAWGDNIYGQLGDGTTSDRWSPVPITLP